MTKTATLSRRSLLKGSGMLVVSIGGAVSLETVLATTAARAQVVKPPLHPEQLDSFIAVDKAGNYAFVGRKNKKRDYRRLWVVRINAAARLNGISYSKLIAGLKAANVAIDRKMLADLAVRDAAAFSEVVKVAQAQAA